LTFEGVGPVLPTPLALSWAQVSAAALTRRPPRPQSRIAPAPTPGGRPRPLPPPERPTRPFLRDSPDAALFRRVAARHLAAFLAPPPAAPRRSGTLEVGALFAEALALTSPPRTFAAGVRDLLASPVPGPTQDATVPTLAFAPSFRTPMVRALAELGEQWLLPGLDGVPANTALALRTNGAFVEAFLVGLNHEFGRELLWREFPSPLTATFFDRFWDAGVAPDEPPDIPPLADWADRALGAPSPGGERFVLLLRSELMRRFPDAVVSASRANPPESLLPVFHGSLDPDVSYFGFALPLEQAHAFSIVIAEQPGAPRFGFEVGEAPAGTSHAPAPDATSAALAARLRQWPARITLPVSVLLGRPTP